MGGKVRVRHSRSQGTWSVVWRTHGGNYGTICDTFAEAIRWADSVATSRGFELSPAVWVGVTTGDKTA